MTTDSGTRTENATSTGTENATRAERPLRRALVWQTTQARLSVQGWVQLILAALVLVVCCCTVVGGVLLSQTNDRTTELVDRIQPARSNVFQLQKSLLDQETGVRGFALTADPSFLAPYAQGREDEQRITRRISGIVSYDPEAVDDLARITRAAEEWRRDQAEPLIASVRTRGAEAASADRLTQSKVKFDEVRELFAAQQSHLDAARDRARAQLNESRDLRDLVLIVILCVFAVAVVCLAVVLHRMVGRPLNALRAASDGVRAGAFDRRIETAGPSDVRAVGAAVEDMRRRLADELAATQSREALLAEQTEELRRSNSELEQFAYVASHDLQEPLRKVASFCQLLEKRYGDQLDSRGKQYIDFAVDGAKRMQILINDLLTFSRVGRVHDAVQTVELDRVLDSALGNLALVIEESGVTVVRPDPLPTVTGDPTTLAMLWQNLVGNAVKFRRPDEPGRIVIGRTREGDEWHLTVTDNGIGVAPEFAERVFIIFQRLHARDEYEGTGIGLALCRKIVEFHGGRIWLEPVPEGGTRIHFTLPVSGAPAATDGPGTATADVSPEDGPPTTTPIPPGAAQ
ncbi:sensor histidine kinase [Streptomyces sp. AK02-01A]|uniref:sensor histidine kinase n=1 Tax=Streptomyces sp. AK02-01A TaxID=3028648 RepID=UPI0029A5D957|nr:CHASE3 domain-containing protein [Streptomyces sp. AK02-01A]MDX3853974.1 CHASE3 domain-containing protein [Streptomyces sp. AK02-01A]